MKTAWRLPLLSLAASLSVCAQDPPFKVTTRLVQTPVFVTPDGRNRPLTARDFIVKDDGRIREVTSIVHGQDRPPMTLLFLIESFRTQARAVSKLPDLLPNALKTLRPLDRVGIARLYPDYDVLLEPTTDRAAVPRTLGRLREEQKALMTAPDAKGSRSFEDLARALIELPSRLAANNSEEHFAIVLVTDDFALLPAKRAAEVSEQLIKRGVVVHALIDARHAGVVIARTNLHALRAITPMRAYVQDRCASHFAEQTGGHVVRVRGGDYASAIQTLMSRLSDVYLVGFTPREEELDGAWHRLQIEANPNGKKKLAVRHRKGYWATP